jgi:hypothetical protein
MIGWIGDWIGGGGEIVAHVDDDGDGSRSRTEWIE